MGVVIVSQNFFPLLFPFFNLSLSEIDHFLLSILNLKEDATGSNIADLILSELKKFDIPISNCISLSTDNAPVMVGSKNGVAANLKKHNPNMHIMGCICHLINIAAEKGSASLPILIDEYLVDIFYYLEKSTKRKEKLIKFQKLHDVETKKILKPVCTRWLSLGKCLARFLDQWKPLLSFFKEEISTSKSKISNSLEDYKILNLKTKIDVPTGKEENACEPQVSAMKDVPFQKTLKRKNESPDFSQTRKKSKEELKASFKKLKQNSHNSTKKEKKNTSFDP